MKTIFDAVVREELIRRINLVKEDGKPAWGKMNVYQMVSHMNIWNEWVLGRNNLSHKQVFLGKLIGNWMLKKDTKDDSPMAKGMPAGKGFTITEKAGDLESQKSKWMNLIREYERYTDAYFMHDFYGKMTREQIAIFAFKHADHHLRQFGV